ncbi:MAG: hypothetical protein QM709_08490 [Spongiibacteraceae bacterium]
MTRTLVPTTLRICALSLVIAATAASAQEEDQSPTQKVSSWRDGVVARCLQQYSAEQCSDDEFLEAHFNINTLETAHKAAIRRNRMADTAMHELILQYACNDSAADVCGDEGAQCIATLTRNCATLKAEAATCLKSAESGCATTANPTSCYKQLAARCPSTKKQPIAQLLAKYPKLSASQKAKLISTAQTLEAKTDNWWSELTSWLTSPFN